MKFERIQEAAYKSKGVIGLPDTPGLSTGDMQRKFDEIALDVIIPAFNQFIDKLNTFLEGTVGERLLDEGYVLQSMADVMKNTDKYKLVSALVIKQFFYDSDMSMQEKVEKFNVLIEQAKVDIDTLVRETTVTINDIVEDMSTVLQDVENGEMLLELKTLYDSLFDLATDEDIDDIVSNQYVDETEGLLLYDIATDEDIDAIIADLFEE